MPKTQLSREAYAEIRLGRLSFREAKRKYHISQSRYAKLRGSTKEYAPTQDQPERDGAAGGTVEGNNFQRAVPQLFLSKKEKQILELSGHNFYERYLIPRQLLEIYTLAVRPLVENGTVVDIICIYPANQFQQAAGKIRYILAEAKPVERHTGKCTDCLATAPDSVPPPALFSDASTCKCGATDHCPTSEKCILWKSKDIPTGPPPKLPPLEIPEEIEIADVVCNIENLHDSDCLWWTVRYARLVGGMAEICPCKRYTCIWRRLAGADICKNLGLDSPETPLGRIKTTDHPDLPNTSIPWGRLELDTPPHPKPKPIPGAPLRPHRRPPRACGGFQQRHPSGTSPRHTPPAHPLGRAMAHTSGAPLRPHRRPPRACGGSQHWHPLWHTPSTGLGHTPPAHPSAHIGGIPGHAAAPDSDTRSAHPGRAMTHPQADPSAHIGGLPGHAAVSNSGTPLAHPLRHTPSAGLWHTPLAHPSAHIGGLPGHAAVSNSGTPPASLRRGYGTPLRGTTPPPT